MHAMTQKNLCHFRSISLTLTELKHDGLVINGTTGQFSIGHAGFMAVGAFSSALCSQALNEYRLGFLPEGVEHTGVVLDLVGALEARDRVDVECVNLRQRRAEIGHQSEAEEKDDADDQFAHRTIVTDSGRGSMRRPRYQAR